MKLYILKPQTNLPEDNNPWNPWYDKLHGIVVSAEDEGRARRLAQLKGKDESGLGNVWLDENYTTCVELIPTEESKIIIMDYRSA